MLFVGEKRGGLKQRRSSILGKVASTGSMPSTTSSGCIRMRNEDVVDLYGKAKVGTKVVVI